MYLQQVSNGVTAYMDESSIYEAFGLSFSRISVRNHKRSTTKSGTFTTFYWRVLAHLLLFYSDTQQVHLQQVPNGVTAYIDGSPMYEASGILFSRISVHKNKRSTQKSGKFK